MPAFAKNQSLRYFQVFIGRIYALPDDRLYSVWDLLSNQERFTMRALKGIRKADHARLQKNLLIAFSWMMAVANRLHIDIESDVWHRFPMLCSYCGHKPCVCKKMKVKTRKKVPVRVALRPRSLAGFQAMFAGIYPPDGRSLADAGVHLAEEMGEVSEAVHKFLGEHKEEHFNEVRLEMADFISSLRTRSGKADRMFYFAFDSPARVVQTRGSAERRDFTAYTFANRTSVVERFLGAA